MNKSTYLIYETGSDYDRLLKLIFIAIPCATFVAGLVLLMENKTDALVLFAVTIFYILLFHSIAPRKLQIYEDRLRIVLGRPFAFSISFDSIETVQIAPGIKSFIYWGVRWATSSHNVVEIVRRKGMNVVISPSNIDAFLEQINDTLKKYG